MIILQHFSISEKLEYNSFPWLIYFLWLIAYEFKSWCISWYKTWFWIFTKSKLWILRILNYNLMINFLAQSLFFFISTSSKGLLSESRFIINVRLNTYKTFYVEKASYIDRVKQMFVRWWVVHMYALQSLLIHDKWRNCPIILINW